MKHDIDRRDILRAGAAISVGALLPWAGRAEAAFEPRQGAWPSFEIVTRLEVANAKGVTQAWIPVPSVTQEAWIRAEASEWTSNAKSAALERNRNTARRCCTSNGRTASRRRSCEVVSRIATRDRAVDLPKPGTVRPLSEAERKLVYRRNRADADRRHRQGDGRQHRGLGASATSKRRGASTSGSSTTRSAIRRRAAAASATSPRC